MSGKALTDGEYRDLMACLIEGVPNRNQINSDAIRAHLANKTDSHDAVAVLLSKPPWVTGDIYPITVDYGWTIELMIAVGHYDWVDPNILFDHFPVKGTGTVQLDAQLVHFCKSIRSKAAFSKLDKMDLRPGTAEEIFAFGAKYPEKQRDFPIAGLGSFWRSVFGGYGVVYLGSGGNLRRSLILDWSGVWSARCRFLAFPK